MANSAFRPYLIKKFVVEVRHKPNLLHLKRVDDALVGFTSDFEKFQTGENSPPEFIYAMASDQHYTRLFCGRSRFGLTIENAANPEDLKSAIGKYLSSLPTKLSIEGFTRIGVRSFILVPFNGSASDMVKYCISKFNGSASIIEQVGTIGDTFYYFTLSDDRYKMNLGLAPLRLDEIDNKIADFKNVKHDFESALYFDLDIYNDSKLGSRLTAFCDAAIDATRMKFLKFYEQL